MSKVPGPKSKVWMGLSGYRFWMLLGFNKIRNSQTEVKGDVKGHSSMFMVQGLLRLLRCLCYSRSVTSPESFMIRSLGKIQGFCFSARYEPFWVVIEVEMRVLTSSLSKTHLFLNLSIIASETRKPAFRSSKAT